MQYRPKRSSGFGTTHVQAHRANSFNDKVRKGRDVSSQYSSWEALGRRGRDVRPRLVDGGGESCQICWPLLPCRLRAGMQSCRKRVSRFRRGNSLGALLRGSGSPIPCVSGGGQIGYVKNVRHGQMAAGPAGYPTPHTLRARIVQRWA